MLEWRDVAVTLGQTRVRLPSLRIHQQDPVADLKNYGTLGRDVLERGYSLDFGSMQLDLQGDAVATSSACATAKAGTRSRSRSR
jgi:hypothetical protein